MSFVIVQKIYNSDFFFLLVPAKNTAIPINTPAVIAIFDIDTATARTIYQFAYNQRLFEVPFQDSIKGWSHGLDGDTYLVEYSTPTHYSFKDYWTPQIQKGINEAAIIDSIDKFFKATLHMDSKWSSFIKGLPKGCYHAGSLFITCNKTKPKRKKDYN